MLFQFFKVGALRLKLKTPRSRRSSPYLKESMFDTVMLAEILVLVPITRMI